MNHLKLVWVGVNSAASTVRKNANFWRCRVVYNLYCRNHDRLRQAAIDKNKKKQRGAGRKVYDVF